MIDENLLLELKEFTDTNKIKEIVTEIENNTEKHTISQFIEELQQINNEIYDKTGFNTVTLDLQCYINELRNKYDVTDPREIIHTDNGKGFVQ